MIEEDKTFDIRKTRRMAVDAMTIADGIFYAIESINKPKKPSVQPTTSETPSAQSKPVELKTLFTKKWGASWLKNSEAYQYFVNLMIQSATMSDTNQVVEYMQQLLASDDAALVRPQT